MKYTFTAAADNYEVTRGYLYGTLTTDQGFDGKSDVLEFEYEPDDVRRNPIFVLDFGDRVEVRYMAGWSAANKQVFLQPFPLSVGERPDGRPIDMSTWMLGPRRAFHLKLTKVED